MKKSSFETIAYSVAGVAVLLVLLVAFNAITATFRKRIDLTRDKAYTLSAGTRAILKKLDTPVKIRFYFSSSAEFTSQTVFLKTYAQHVRDLLTEFKQAANGKLIVEQYDPKPASDAEDSARVDGVEGQALPSGERFYMGLCVSMVDAKEPIAFLDPRRERSLEYDVSRAISRVGKTEKTVIGIMSPLPVFGAPSNPMMARMGQQGAQPWYLVSELQGDYTVKPVEMNAEKIDDDIRVLLVIQPRDITDQAQFAIDQFIMRGGKVIAFLDATCLSDKRNDGNPVMAQLPGGGSTLDKLLKAWGLQFDNTKVVADLTYMNRRVKLSQADNPAWIELTGDAINKDDIASSEIDKIWIPFGGAFTGTPVAGLKETVLLKSSKESQLVEGMMAVMASENALNNIATSGTNYAFGIRLAGKFKTAFPNGKPEDKTPGVTNAPPAASLKETKEDNSVVLFGDADMVSDQFTIQKMNSPFGVIVQPWNANQTLVMNLVEQMSGDNDLINVRSRATQERPFTRINEMQANAEKIHQSKIKELMEKRQQARENLAKLEKDKDPSQRYVRSPEQEAEVKKYKMIEADTIKELNLEQKKLTKDIDALENRLKWSNILVMPGLVTLSGICLAVFKRKRTSAK
jgi:ABC-type uncharacterized transport system involved in gliding motility auxiliary subunit